jgi:flagellar basal body rod protein FlgC
MSKTGQWVLEMQEDAQELNREQFIAKHGIYQVHIWDEQSEQSKDNFAYDPQNPGDFE